MSQVEKVARELNVANKSNVQVCGHCHEMVKQAQPR
jgi:hypothetical protein